MRDPLGVAVASSPPFGRSSFAEGDLPNLKDGEEN